jgi:hypothetical protein
MGGCQVLFDGSVIRMSASRLVLLLVLLLVRLLVRARSRSEAVFVDPARFVDDARARMGVLRRIAEPSNRTYT